MIRVITTTNDTIPVRKGEGLDAEVLLRFLRENCADLPEGELGIRQFGTGHSNLTYELEIGTWQAVLRRPPIGPVAAESA